MPDPDDGGRAAGIALSEFRLLAVERRVETVEERMRAIELSAARVEEKVDGFSDQLGVAEKSVKDEVKKVDTKIDTLNMKFDASSTDKYKNLWGFMLTIGAVIATFLLDHLIAWGQLTK